jgi:hypothetical protein
MTDVKKLVMDVLENRVDLADLTDQESDTVILALHKFGNDLIESGHQDAGLSILDITTPFIDEIMHDMDHATEQLIQEAVARGCVLYKPDYHDIH